VVGTNQQAASLGFTCSCHYLMSSFFFLFLEQNKGADVHLFVLYYLVLLWNHFVAATVFFDLLLWLKLIPPN
jgi:hypothetical protein